MVNNADRDASAAGGSETQQNQATSGWRAIGGSMLTSPPVAVRVTHVRCRQTKSLGPRLETMTIRGPITPVPSRGASPVVLIPSVPARPSGPAGPGAESCTLIADHAAAGRGP